MTYWTHRSQIWKVERSLYKLLERVFDRVNRDDGVCGQVTHSRYKTTYKSWFDYDQPNRLNSLYTHYKEGRPSRGLVHPRTRVGEGARWIQVPAGSGDAGDNGRGRNGAKRSGVPLEGIPSSGTCDASGPLTWQGKSENGRF